VTAKKIEIFQKRRIINSKTIPALLIIIFIVQGIIFSGMFPLWDGWDEPAHFAYVQHIAEKKELPSLDDKISNEIQSTLPYFPLNRYLENFGTNYQNFWSNFKLEEFLNDKKLVTSIPYSERTISDFNWPLWEAQLPPLGHIAQVPVYLMFYDQDILTRVFALRIFSVLVAAVAAIFAYKTISLIFQDRFMRIGSLMFIVFNPMFTTNIARVNNEAITILLFSIFLYLMVLYLKSKPTTTYALLIGIILGLGLLSKTSFIAAVALVPIFIFLKHFQNKNNKPSITIPQSLKNLGIVFGITIPVTFWWYFDRISSGNFSGLTDFQMDRFASGNFTGINPLPVLTMEEYFHGLFEFNWLSFYEYFFKFFWGAYGWNFYFPPFPYYEIIMIFVGICLAGLVYGITKRIKQSGSKLFQDWRYASVFVLSLSILFIILGQSFISIPTYYALGFGVMSGWYLFIAITAISMLVILGFRTFIINSVLKKFHNESLLISFIILVIFNASVLFWLIPKYYLGI